MHGAGYSKKSGGRPVIHARYSKYLPEAQARLARHYKGKARDNLDHALLATIYQRLPTIGAALDVQIAAVEASDGGPKTGLAIVEAQGEVLRQILKLSAALAETALTWVVTDPYADLVLRAQAARTHVDGGQNYV